MIIMIAAVAVIAKQALVGAGIAVVGVLLFWLGMNRRRQAGVVSQIPEVPIGNIPAGPVHVHGKTTGEERLVSPITGASCFYYKLQVEKRVKQGDQERWENYKNDAGQRNFYLEDATGRVLVDPQQAEFDLPQTLRAEIGPGSGHYCHVDPALGIGMLTENQVHAALVSGWSEARAALAGMGASGGVAKAADAVLATGQKMAEWGVSVNVGGVEINPGMMGESLRIQETCLLAGREYSVIGTCDQDEQNRKVIRKGKTEKTFLISLKTGEQLVRGLRMQGTVMMVIGVVLILGAAAWVLTQR